MKVFVYHNNIGRTFFIPPPDLTPPQIVSATINSIGSGLSINWSENVTGAGGLSINPSSGIALITYLDGNGTSLYNYSINRAIYIGESVTLSSLSSSIADLSSNFLVDFSGMPVTNNSVIIAGNGESLRPSGVFPSIPNRITASGFVQNDLRNSIRTNVSGTSRAATIDIAGGTYTSPIICNTGNRRIRLLGDVTFDGGGFIAATSNLTFDLNGYNLKYMENDLEDWEIGYVVSKSGGDGITFPMITTSGLVSGGVVLQFLNGVESGNWYYKRSESVFPSYVLENDTNSTDNGNIIRSWQVSGGPNSGDMFRIFDPRKTFGIGTLAGIYGINNVEIINGFITQGAAAQYGRGFNEDYNLGCAPIETYQGQTNWMVGGVRITWGSANTSAIHCEVTSAMHVQYCEFNDTGYFLSNRQRALAAVSVGDNANIHHNRVINHRHIGFACGDSNIIEYNEIYGDSRATNPAGINTYAGKDNIFRYNNIYKVGEHPIGIALHSDGCTNNQVYGNWCESKSTRSSAEYGWNYAVALSNRWGLRTGVNNIYNNVFVTYSQDGTGLNEQSRGRTMFFGSLERSSGEIIRNCFIGAYSTDQLTESHAVGLSLNNKNVLFSGCILEGTQNLLWLGDTYGPAFSGARFIDCSTYKSGSYSGFSTYAMWDYLTGCIDVIGMKYGSGTSETGISIQIDGYSSPQKINFGDMLTVTVTGISGPVSGASVSVIDSGNITIRSGYITNSNGVIAVDTPNRYRARPGFASVTLNPLKIMAISGSLSGSGNISPTGINTINIGVL